MPTILLSLVPLKRCVKMLRYNQLFHDDAVTKSIKTMFQLLSFTIVQGLFDLLLSEMKTHFSPH